jgi:hypothetical protein
MTNRVHIDAPAGVVEIEGEKEFVEGLLAKLFPLLEKTSFGSRPPSGNPALPVEELAEGEDVALEQTGKSKTKKRSANKPPKGHSCADRILTLKTDGFFKEHRSTGDIVEGLKNKGWTHAANQVGAALTNMFGRQEIQRTKEGSGSWKYFWDRG